MNRQILRRITRLLFTGLLFLASRPTPARRMRSPRLSWSTVLRGIGQLEWRADRLIAKDFPVMVVANAARCEVRCRVRRGGDRHHSGTVVLVGHSYGGLVISNAGCSQQEREGAGICSAFAAEPGETASDLSGPFPGSTLGPTLAPPVALPDGGKDYTSCRPSSAHSSPRTCRKPTRR